MFFQFLRFLLRSSILSNARLSHVVGSHFKLSSDSELDSVIVLCS